MTNPLALVERVQTLLAQTDAPLAKLEEGLFEIERVMASNNADLEEIDSRRKIEMTAATPASELDKKLDALDKRKREIERRTEIASIVLAELETRIAAVREQEQTAKQQANYMDALELRETTVARLKKFLNRVGHDSREIMRAYAESELRTNAVNSALPPGASPIPSIEAARRGELAPPKTTVKKYKMFVAGQWQVGEEGHVKATPRSDGRYDVWLPGGSSNGGEVVVCDCVDYVDLTVETDATPWPDFFATSLSVPAFFVTQHPGWRPIATDVGPVFPERIGIELDKLESSPPFRFVPRVDQRTMSLANWRRLNGETLEADPFRAQLAAE
jgi:hypothetical protein